MDGSFIHSFIHPNQIAESTSLNYCLYLSIATGLQDPILSSTNLTNGL